MLWIWKGRPHRPRRAPGCPPSESRRVSVSCIAGRWVREPRCGTSGEAELSPFGVSTSLGAGSAESPTGGAPVALLSPWALLGHERERDAAQIGFTPSPLILSFHTKSIWSMAGPSKPVLQTPALPLFHWDPLPYSTRIPILYSSVIPIPYSTMACSLSRIPLGSVPHPIFHQDPLPISHQDPHPLLHRSLGACACTLSRLLVLLRPHLGSR